MLGKISAEMCVFFLFLFVVLLFAENTLWHFMQIVSFAWNVKARFLEEYLGNIINLSSVEFILKATKVNVYSQIFNLTMNKKGGSLGRIQTSTIQISMFSFTFLSDMWCTLIYFLSNDSVKGKRRSWPDCCDTPNINFPMTLASCFVIPANDHKTYKRHESINFIQNLLVNQYISIWLH